MKLNKHLRNLYRRLDKVETTAKGAKTVRVGLYFMVFMCFLNSCDGTFRDKDRKVLNQMESSIEKLQKDVEILRNLKVKHL